MADWKTTSVRLTPENHAFVSNSGSIQNFLNDLLDKVRRGQFVDAAAIAENKQQLVCIYNMPDSKSLDMTCPVKSNHKFLCGDDRLGDLLSACRQCPRKAEYLLLLKKGVRPDSTSVTPAAAAKAAGILPFTIKCFECDKEWDSEFYEDYKQPLFDMHHAIASHLKMAHGIDVVPPDMSPFRMQNKLKEEMQQP